MPECRTCRWWFENEPDKAFTTYPQRLCVLLTGLNAHGVSVMLPLHTVGGGTIYTRPDFGCVKHEERTSEH